MKLRDTDVKRIVEFKNQLDAGHITEDRFEEKKKEKDYQQMILQMLKT